MAHRRSWPPRLFQTALGTAMLAAGRGWAAADLVAEPFPPATVLFGAGVLAAALLGTLGWVYRLRLQVRQSTAALHAAREELEHRVRERTAELDAANCDLRD